MRSLRSSRDCQLTAELESSCASEALARPLFGTRASADGGTHPSVPTQMTRRTVLGKVNGLPHLVPLAPPSPTCIGSLQHHGGVASCASGRHRPGGRSPRGRLSPAAVDSPAASRAADAALPRDCRALSLACSSAWARRRSAGITREWWLPIRATPYRLGGVALEG